VLREKTEGPITKLKRQENTRGVITIVSVRLWYAKVHTLRYTRYHVLQTWRIVMLFSVRFLFNRAFYNAFILWGI